jgi:hypothetical protein
MKSAFRQFVLGLGLFSCSMPLTAQVDRWKGFQFLIGQWTGGDGGSSTGQGSGTFSFQLDVDGKVLMRRNHAEYPASKDKPALRHDYLMMIYSETTRRRKRCMPIAKAMSSAIRVKSHPMEQECDF